MADPEQDFLDSLRVDPDDATRQVYADWLEDRGDERGEYLRIELAMATESPFVPRYWELKERRTELRAATDPVWLEAVGYPTYYTPMFGTIPADRLERWRMVDRFVDFWREEPLTRTSGNTEDEITAREAELGVRFPAALREWYLLAGRRVDVWTRQDYLEPLHRVQVDDSGILLFRRENQGCELWGVSKNHLEQADPPVVRALESAVDCDTVSSFALQQMVYEAIIGGSHGGHAEPECPDSVTMWMRRETRRCALPVVYWCLEMVFSESRDMLVLDSLGDEWLYLSTRTQAAFEAIDPAVRDALEPWS